LLQRFCTVLGLVIGAGIAAGAAGQAYPNRPIRIIATQPPGAGTDIVARLIAQRLSAVFGQPVIVDNRGGASGNIATMLVAKASPDGYTLLFTTPAHATNPSVGKVSYDPVKDFAPITQINSQAFLIVMHPALPVKSVKEFVAYAHAKQGRLTYGTAGIGVAGHLGMELFKTLARFDAVHVPYKGGGPAIIDVIAGQVDAAIVSALALLPHVRSGKVHALAVTSIKRSALLPDVPTIAESGFPEYEVSSWYGMLAPAGTPRATVARLYEEVSRILKLPDIRERFLADGSVPVGNTPEEFTAYIRAEVVKWAGVVKRSGARLD